MRLVGALPPVDFRRVNLTRAGLAVCVGVCVGNGRLGVFAGVAADDDCPVCNIRILLLGWPSESGVDLACPSHEVEIVKLLDFVGADGVANDCSFGGGPPDEVRTRLKDGRGVGGFNCSKVGSASFDTFDAVVDRGLSSGDERRTDLSGGGWLSETGDPRACGRLVCPERAANSGLEAGVKAARGSGSLVGCESDIGVGGFISLVGLAGPGTGIFSTVQVVRIRFSVERRLDCLPDFNEVGAGARTGDGVEIDLGFCRTGEGDFPCLTGFFIVNHT